MTNQGSRLGLGLLAALAVAGPAAAQDTGWAGGVRADGWPDRRGTSDGGMIILRPAARKGRQGYPRLQLRYEYRDGVKMGGRMFFTLLAVDEYDCKAGKLRNIRMAAFTGHNAEGQSVQDDSGEAWKAPAPGTVDGKS